MPANPKIFVHGEVYNCCFRTLTGLPLPPNAVVIEILLSCLAKAQMHYPVIIGDFCFMSNHVHLMIRVIDPTVVDQFFRYFKTESALAINRMMRRQKGPVWEEGYDSPPVLEHSKYVEKAAYHLLNPQQADLIERIEHYPHLNSWKALNSENGEFSIECYDIRRFDVPLMPVGAISKASAVRLRDSMIRKAKKRKRVVLKISPKKCFEAFKRRLDENYSWATHRQVLIEEIRSGERKLSDERARKGKGILGSQALRTASMHVEHTPVKHGQKMICLAEDPEIRVDYINWFRRLVRQYRAAIGRWRDGDHSVEIPLGFFPPGGMRPRVALLPAEFPF